MSKVNPRRARHMARRLALQALYQWQVTRESLDTVEQQFLSSPHAATADMDYFHQLLQQIAEQSPIVDDFIKTYSTRPFSDIGPIELATLRIGIYELKFCLDVPYRVVLNEAIELSKKFGAVESHKYVNGILDKVAACTREIEINGSH